MSVCTFLASPRRRKLRILRPRAYARAKDTQLRLLSPHSPLTLGLCGVPHPKECGQRGAPLCNPPHRSGVRTIHRRRPEFVCSGTPAPAAARRHVLHIVRIRLTANAHSFRRSAFPQPAHVVGPGRGPRAWQGPQSAPGLVLGGSANVPPLSEGVMGR